jgi:phosphate transport system permease protein
MKYLEEKIFRIIMISAALIVLSVLLFIIGTIFYKGFPALSLDMITKLPGGGFYLGKEGGILNAIVGSLYIIAGSVFISLLISVPLVMYINFYLPRKSRFTTVVRFSLDILFGVPSIVYGAFGFALMVYLGMRHRCSGSLLHVQS